jgi:hypothetical protein
MKAMAKKKKQPEAQKARYRWTFVPLIGVLRFDENDVIKIVKAKLGSKLDVAAMGAVIADALNSAQDYQIIKVNERVRAATPREKLAPPGQCKSCDEYRRLKDRMYPWHDASPGCESGHHNHCTCDICF